MADGRLNFDTHLDSSGVTTGLSSLKKAILKLGIGALAAKVGKDILGMGIGFNAQIQSYQTNFEVLTGSADKAMRHVRELKEMGAKTPFELTDLANASQTIQAFGTKIEDVNGVLTMLGDISLGNKEKFSSLALVYGQVRSQGRLMGQDLLQMINAGFNPLEVISKKTGKSMADLKEEMADGLITFEMVEDAMKSATSEGGRFYQGMEKASQTFTGKLSTLKDTANEFFGVLTNPLFNKLSDVVLPKAIKAMEFLRDHTKEVTLVIQFLGTTISAAFAAYKFKAIVSGIKAIGLAMKGFIIANPWVLLATAIAAAAFAIGMFIKNGGDLEELWEQVEDFLDNLPELINDVVDKITEVLPKVIQGLLSSIVKALPALVRAGVAILLALVKGLTQAIPELIAAIPEIIASILTGLLDALPDILQAGFEMIVALIGGILMAIPDLVAAAPKILMALLDALGALVIKFFELGVLLLARLWDGIVSIYSWVKEKTAGIGSAIWSAIKSGLGSLYEIGANLIKGLWEGIKSCWSWIKNKIGDFCSDVWGGIKSFFGINSPSRLMKQAGKWIGEGLGLGIEDSTADVLGKVTAQTRAIADAYGELDSSVKWPTGILKAPKVVPALSGLFRSGQVTNGADANVNQTFNFYEPHKTPHDTARLLRKEAIVLGLAGNTI